MNQYQTNRTNMIEAVIAFLEIHTAEVAESTGLTSAVTEIKTLASAVREKSNEKKGSTQGKRDKKDSSANALSKHVVKIAAGLSVWAKKNDNIEIKALTNFSRSDFNSLRDAEKYNFAKAVYDAATGKDLAFAKITAEQITQLKTLADQFKNDIAGINTGKSKKSAAGKSIRTLIDEAMEIITEECDKLMLQYEEEKPDFFNGYKSVRVIYSNGGKKKEETNQPVPVNP